MPCKTRFTLTTTAVLTVFILSAMWTVPAFADDSTPPPVETPTEEVAPPPAEPAAVEPALTEPAPLTELLEQLPEGTDLVVTDAAGEAVPLATQEAAQAATFKDPIWCPDGVTPIANTGGCSPSYLTLETLVADVGTGFIPAKNGTIWIEDGPEGSANPIVFNGGAVNFGTWANFSLTLQGGWTTVGKTINSLDPSKLNKQLYILNWNANVTLKDIVLNGVASNVIVDDNALYITTTRNILLDRVTVQNSLNNNASFEMSGAYLDNSAGTGTITINNSNFQGNEGNGLYVLSKGVITTNNLTANLNGKYGVYIDNSFALTDKAITMKGLKQFNKNGSDGLVIFSDGLVTLSNIVANNNGGNGVYVDNRTSLTNLGVTVIGTNYFMGNTGGDGLFVSSYGVITANNLNASNNFGTGASLDNCDLDINSDCSVIYAKLVKLSGVNTFSSNGNDGLDILSFGAIYVNSVNASGNGGNGAYMDNQWTNNALLPKDSVGTWTLTGYNIFNNNGVNGLLGYSHGNMLLNNLTANDNGDNGLELDAQKFIGSASVTIKGVNTFNNNDFDGLYIFSNGKIALSSITASGNLIRGVDLDNFSGLGITLTGVNNFSNNGETGVYAIQFRRHHRQQRHSQFQSIWRDL